MPPSPRTIRAAAEAVREHARLQHAHLTREPDYGVVQQIEPLRVEMLGSAVVLDDDQLVITQGVRQYDSDVGLAVGDGLKVQLMRNGDWLVEEVISDVDVFPASSGSVTSVTAADSSIAVAGTASDPTVAVASGGITSGKIATGAVGSAAIADGSITDAEIAAANKDGAAGVPSMRTLGTGATQAAAGNDARLSDARTPTGPAGGDLAGTFPNPTVKASVGLTGAPTALTAAVDTSTTQLATTAFVLGQASSSTPSMDGAGAVGVSTRYARADHVHPTDTTRAPLASPTFTGVPAAPTAAVDTSTTQLATTAFVIGQASAAGDGTPAMDGAAARGTSTHYARADHVHPTDTSRAADSLVVHLAGAESLTGAKTFSAGPRWATQTVTTAATLADGSAPVVLADTTAAAFTLTLPAAPTAGSEFRIVDKAGTFGTNNLTIGRNAKNIDGAAANLVLNRNWSTVTLYYDGTGWHTTAAGLSSVASGVSSVFGRTGAVVKAAGDYAVADITGAAPLASPTLTGTPAAPTAAVDTSTTQLATTAFVLGQASSTTPAMDGAGAVGTSTRYARADHVHPTDTTRAPLASPTFTGVPAAPTAATGTSTTQLATTAFVQGSLASQTPRLTVTQTAHGFTVGQLLYYTGTAYALALADTIDAAEVVGIVSAVIDANNFTLLMVGQVPGMSGLTAGATYFLSDATAGAITTAPPSTDGHVEKPVGVAVSTTVLLFANMRGEVVRTSTTFPRITTSAYSGGPPPSPADGDIWYATAVDANGTRWQFQYNAGSASAYKWEFVGGPPLEAHVDTANSTTSAAYVDLGTAGPSLSIARAGDYIIEFGAQFAVPAAVTGYMSYALTGGSTYGPNDADSNSLGNTGSGTANNVGAMTRRVNGVVAATTATAKYRSNSVTGVTFQQRWMKLTPVRIS